MRRLSSGQAGRPPGRGGQEGRLTQSFYQGYGFSGILIAFLARNNPVAALVVALLMAMLFVAGRSLNDQGAADILWVPGQHR